MYSMLSTTLVFKSHDQTHLMTSEDPNVHLAKGAGQSEQQVHLTYTTKTF